MSVMFDPSEIFLLAIRIEENGEKFYTAMSKKLKDPEAKELFKFLAAEETEHRKFYKESLSEIEKNQPQRDFPEDYFRYLKAYADNVIFSQKTFEKKVNEIVDPASAIDFAIQAEIDSILYYQEIKNIVPENKHKKIDIIVDEERKHFVKLSKIKNKFI
jgi:rubrerythrin